jgi:hypothetical protein
MYIICININVEEEMKKLLDLGFKKVPTEDGFVMYELNPAALRKPQVTSKKPQATSSKQQAASRKQQALDKVK